MPLPPKIESFIENLPDETGTRRFFRQFAEKFPREEKKLLKNEGLLSDVLTLAAFSPLLATTILQNPDYIWWLNRQRVSSKVRDKEELLESLARFALTNSDVDANILLARFRRRELLRIYLRDIRNLGTIAEITEEISNLADAVLEYALRQARQELDNRYGAPFESDEKSKAKLARFCIVALGKLGSLELNYSSDIDLLFLYSDDGTTSGQGARGVVTNREYFIKLAEQITKIVGGQTGEGAAYRVDLRLRPNGRVGALAISCKEAVNYYQTTARNWERQVLIRSRPAAGDARLFQEFFKRVETDIFSKDETVENALRNVRLSKEKINAEKISGKNFNVKLGAGGIREIEFIAQALQLAYAGKDSWLRAAHTLISISRLADRRLISETELTGLFNAYEFLRRLEHRLQMENGLQTHVVPSEETKRLIVARRMNCENLTDFETDLNNHVNNVSRVFSRVFKDQTSEPLDETANARAVEKIAGGFDQKPDRIEPLLSSLKKSGGEINSTGELSETLARLSEVSPHFAELIASSSHLVKHLPTAQSNFAEKDYQKTLLSAVEKQLDFKNELAILRQSWSQLLTEIVVADAFEKITRREAKNRQTKLAEASVETALFIVRRELERRFSTKINEFPFAVTGLGKLGGGGMDYGSDLDLVLIYDDEKQLAVKDVSLAEFYGRAVEIFVTTLSSLTREGLLYRVDLRLRPDGKNGANSSGKRAFLNYLQTRAAIWEWLAYVKLRGVAGDVRLAAETEAAAGKIIRQNAQSLLAQNDGLKTLSDETKRVRDRLEEKSLNRRASEIDIKYGAGGMLDVYFAVRFLQLKHDVPDDAANRSTFFTLEKLQENNFLIREAFQNFFDGYQFLSELDHNLRLTVGRSTRLPTANPKIIETIRRRMRIASTKDLLEQLTVHRLNIRASFDAIFDYSN